MDHLTALLVAALHILLTPLSSVLPWDLIFQCPNTQRPLHGQNNPDQSRASLLAAAVKFHLALDVPKIDGFHYQKFTSSSLEIPLEDDASFDRRVSETLSWTGGDLKSVQEYLDDESAFELACQSLHTCFSHRYQMMSVATGFCVSALILRFRKSARIALQLGILLDFLTVVCTCLQYRFAIHHEFSQEEIEFCRKLSLASAFLSHAMAVCSSETTFFSLLGIFNGVGSHVLAAAFSALRLLSSAILSYLLAVGLDTWILQLILLPCKIGCLLFLLDHRRVDLKHQAFAENDQGATRITATGDTPHTSRHCTKTIRPVFWLLASPLPSAVPTFIPKLPGLLAISSVITIPFSWFLVKTPKTSMIFGIMIPIVLISAAPGLYVLLGANLLVASSGVLLGVQNSEVEQTLEEPEQLNHEGVWTTDGANAGSLSHQNNYVAFLQAEVPPSRRTSLPCRLCVVHYLGCCGLWAIIFGMSPCVGLNRGILGVLTFMGLSYFLE